MADFYAPTGTKYEEKYNTPVQQQKEFSETWCEWAAKNRQPVFIFNGGGAGTINLYQVPAGFTLYVTSLNHSMTPIANANVVSLIYQNLFGTGNISNLCCNSPTASPVAHSCSYPMPLKFNSGDILYLYVSVNCISYASIQGFLEQNQA